MSAILRLAKTYPFRFGLGYSLMKTSGCDLMVQKVVEKREIIDWKRNIAFGAFGFFYLGGVQYMIYVPLFSRIFPNAAAFAGKSVADKLRDPRGIRDLFAQVFLDQGVHHPLMYFPVFYMIKDFVTSDSPNPVCAVNQYIGNMNEDLVALWKVWIPSTLLNFAFMPMWARIPWVASTSLIWTCILSAMRGSSEVPAEEGVFGHVDAQTLGLMTTSAIAPAPRLSPDKSHLLVTAMGPDRPGVIAAIARELYGLDASISHSKMMCLGAEFCIVMHVECSEAQLKAVRAALGGASLAGKGVEVLLRDLQPHSDSSKVVPAVTGRVSLTGIDRPGLLYRLSDTLSAAGLNIDHLQTEQLRTKRGAPPLFNTQCHFCGDKRPDVPSLRAGLQKLEAELGVKCTLEVAEGPRRHLTSTISH
ncbi:hypothetical protein EMIHUDRAFT_111890 [Emiliania huxleyi CCMP1516]|uniref:ACT domain-containing protein n=2 Tax=Emiliania huxleyi TaxID=2903 RepID=A0A0D3KC32_EMIH1|nr:hypothetical protein EMIHUDRAFT_111890 [Emiliania huxleyi CCMP1516]EOD33317.1 hypothetical protein EMIHUDRAFT_111890 [Emiliania huxleyi CCMP1516]|eukprot:XP_005785746.1 hypothetical protein EMIHUDRAFT_111890 [Emiliania huxleyi CCMP1516]